VARCALQSTLILITTMLKTDVNQSKKFRYVSARHFALGDR
jgi:hypothetical protein